MPPTAFRRPVTISIWLVMSLACLALSPLLLAAGAVGSLLLRRPQPLLLVRLLIEYFARELCVLVACGALWLASGVGLRLRRPRFQLFHYRLLRWFLHGIVARVVEMLGISVVAEPSPEAARALEGDAPLLFFGRHAGPGDTLLLLDLMLWRYGRFPSVVFKEALTIDPCVDLIAHRLPHAVLDSEGGPDGEERIREVAAELGARGVLMLFPEGGNFTPERRRRALRRLRRKGRTREAAAGEQMSHVLPPYPGGAAAALAGADGADVLFSAHTGLGLAAFPRQLWHDTPIHRTFVTRMWLVPARERPSDPEEQTRWIYAWWKRIDEWIERTAAEDEKLAATD
jgi:1-acyl-sn-glycerol-3-phosphate acyltransferase